MSSIIVVAAVFFESVSQGSGLSFKLLRFSSVNRTAGPFSPAHSSASWIPDWYPCYTGFHKLN